MSLYVSDSGISLSMFINDSNNSIYRKFLENITKVIFCDPLHDSHVYTI